MTLPIPRTSARTEGEVFAEVQGILGPEQIGVTGQNTYEELYGRPYLLVLTTSGRLRLYRGEPAGGGYAEVTEGVPDIIFGPALPAGARRFTAAFDQSARIIVAYELDGVVRVTRWTGSAYVQNVTFAGVDPCLIMDATLSDPRGYPTAADGWNMRETRLAGIPVLFEWLAGDPVVWLENAIPDSDVLLFYLTPDRLGLRARVQRQVYATEQTVHDFDAPVVMDRVIGTPGRYQALVSDADGVPLAQMILSDPYLGDFMPNPRITDPMPSDAAPDTMVATREVENTEGDDDMAAAVAVDDVAVVGDTAFTTGSDAADGDLTPEGLVAVSNVAATTDSDMMDGAFATDSPVQVVRAIEPATDSDDLDATFAPEVIRVQTV